MEERSDEPQLADIRDHWHWVRDGIQEILEDQKQLTFIPEDVYAAYYVDHNNVINPYKIVEEEELTIFQFLYGTIGSNHFICYCRHN